MRLLVVLLVLLGTVCVIVDIEDVFQGALFLTASISGSKITTKESSSVNTTDDSSVNAKEETSVGKTNADEEKREQNHPWEVPILDLDTALQKNISLYPVRLGHSGFGSQVNHLIARLVYYGQSTTMIVKTMGYYMQYNDTTGVLGGWFNPSFPLVQNIEDWSKLPTSLQQSMRNCQDAPNGSFRNKKYHKKFRDELPYKRPDHRVTYEFYAEHGEKACQNFQFNQAAKQTFQKLRTNHGIPDFRDPATGKTVAFHVRRGDKLKHESRLITGEEYVQKLLDVTTMKGKEDIKHCFVATDDYQAVAELKEALNNHNIDCQLHTLTKEEEHGHGEKAAHRGVYNKDTWDEFFAETHMLIEATYFVGAMNSNVARFVALMRYCAHADAPNFHHSYDVEGMGWYPL